MLAQRILTINGMEPTEDGIYEIALTTFRYIVDEINVRYSQIILFGRSLGSGPAVYLAVTIVLEATKKETTRTNIILLCGPQHVHHIEI